MRFQGLQYGIAFDYDTILNYFDNLSTNVSTEAFKRKGAPCQNQSLSSAVPRGKKRRTLPLSTNSVICLNQVDPQLLTLIRTDERAGFCLWKVSQVERSLNIVPIALFALLLTSFWVTRNRCSFAVPSYLPSGKYFDLPFIFQNQQLHPGN